MTRHLLLALAVGGTAHASPVELAHWRTSIDGDTLVVQGPVGEAHIRCTPTQIVRSASVRSTAGGWAHTATATGWSATCTASTPTSTWVQTVDVRAKHPTIRWTTEVTATSAYKPDVEAAHLRLIGSASTWTRAWQRTPVRGPRVLDRWMPRRVDTPGITVQSDAPSLLVVGRDRAVDIRVELDHAEEHPRVRYHRCAKNWSVDLESERDEEGSDVRAAGDRMTATTWLHVGGLPEVTTRRWPRAREAALVFTDHADPGSAARLDTLAWGSQANAKSAPDDRTPNGMIGHGLRWTQTVFAEDYAGYTRQLTDPKFVARLRELTAAGVDVGPHSPRGGPDTQEVVQRSLHALQSLADSRTWIDHQPTTNCEALASSGSSASGEWSVLSQLEGAGYDYAWATLDVQDRITNADIWQVADHARRPVLYPGLAWVEGGRRSWWFSSQWRAIKTPRFLKAYAPERLDELQRRHGLHIAHTYLMSRGTGPAGALWEQGAGGLRLQPKVEALFADLGRRQADGRLWVAGLPEMADHLRAASGVHVDVIDPHTLSVEQRSGPRANQGFTLLVPAQLGWPTLDDQPMMAEQIVPHPDGLLLLLHLTPHVPRTLGFVDEHDRAVLLTPEVEIHAPL